MKKVRLIITTVLVATSCNSFAQMQDHKDSTKLIAVVNTANWCSVCEANGVRFAATIMPYASKGLKIYINNLTNDTTQLTSRNALNDAGIYNALFTLQRKGMGKMLKSCGLLKDKKQSGEASGIVTFIDPKTLKQIKQLSIAEPDDLMNSTINNLLN